MEKLSCFGKNLRFAQMLPQESDVTILNSLIQPLSTSLPTHSELVPPWGDVSPLVCQIFYISRHPHFIQDRWFGHWNSATVMCNIDYWFNKRLWRKMQVWSMVFGCVFIGNIEVICRFSQACMCSGFVGFEDNHFSNKIGSNTLVITYYCYP